MAKTVSDLGGYAVSCPATLSSLDGQSFCFELERDTTFFRRAWDVYFEQAAGNQVTVFRPWIRREQGFARAYVFQNQLLSVLIVDAQKLTFAVVNLSSLTGQAAQATPPTTPNQAALDTSKQPPVKNVAYTTVEALKQFGQDVIPTTPLESTISFSIVFGRQAMVVTTTSRSVQSEGGAVQNFRLLAPPVFIEGQMYIPILALDFFKCSYDFITEAFVDTTCAGIQKRLPVRVWR